MLNLVQSLWGRTSTPSHLRTAGGRLAFDPDSRCLSPRSSSPLSCSVSWPHQRGGARVRTNARGWPSSETDNGSPTSLQQTVPTCHWLAQPCSPRIGPRACHTARVASHWSIEMASDQTSVRWKGRHLDFPQPWSSSVTKSLRAGLSLVKRAVWCQLSARTILRANVAYDALSAIVTICRSDKPKNLSTWFYLSMDVLTTYMLKNLYK